MKEYIDGSIKWIPNCRHQNLTDRAGSSGGQPSAFYMWAVTIWGAHQEIPTDGAWQRSQSAIPSSKLSPA